MMLYPEDAHDPRATFPGLEWACTREQVAQLASFTAKHAGDLAERNMAKMGINWVTFEGRRMEYRPAQPGAHYELIVAATRGKGAPESRSPPRAPRHRRPSPQT